MTHEMFGMLSGTIVIVSIIPYTIRTYQRKITPNPASWSLWTLIGLTLLLTYKSSGAEANVWPAVFGFTNPLLITLILIKRHSEWEKLNRVEQACLVLGLVSLGLWAWLQGNKELVQYALYLSIAADACAAIPTVYFVWTQPDKERPFAWGLFSIGYGLAVFAITEHTFANYVLPIYMCLGSASITLPLILYRLRNNAPLREWA